MMLCELANIQLQKSLVAKEKTASDFESDDIINRDCSHFSFSSVITMFLVRVCRDESNHFELYTQHFYGIDNLFFFFIIQFKIHFTFLTNKIIPMLYSTCPNKTFLVTLLQSMGFSVAAIKLYMQQRNKMENTFTKLHSICNTMNNSILHWGNIVFQLFVLNSTTTTV